MRSPLALLLLLLLPACGGSSAPTTQVNPAASPASTAASPASMSTSSSQDAPSCLSPPSPPDVLDHGRVDPSDPHFPVNWYEDCHQLNDNYPWQPVNNVPFVPSSTYSRAQQDLVTQNEERIFHATEKWATEAGITRKELGITHPDNPLASGPPPVSEFTTSELPTPPEATSQGSTGFTLSNDFGNRLFGAGYDGATSFSYARSANEGRMNIQSHANVTANLFHTTRALVSFVVSNECICNLQSLTAPPRTTGLGAYYLMGHRVSAGNWPGSFSPRGPRRVFERRNHRFFGARMRFMVGPVPMMLEASVTGEAALDVDMSPNCPELTLNITPTADLRVSTSWSVNVRIIRAGIQANLSLLNLTMPMHGSLRITPTFCADWRANLNRTATTLNGNIELFSTVRFLFFQEHFTLNIARWTGRTLSDRSAERTGQFCPLPN